MIWWLLLPTAIAIGAAFAAATIQRRLRPDWATWTLTALAGGTALAVLWALGGLAISFAVEQPLIADLFGWCTSLFSSHDRVPAAVGIAAWAAIVTMAVAGSCKLRQRRSALAEFGEEILRVDEPLAFAVPGRPGRVVVSTGMLASLDRDELTVLFAHEHSHLRHHHHRFLHVAEIAAAAVPLLRPLSRQVRFATERWADEDAAQEVGDRRIVARAIARAALAANGESTPLPSLAAFAGYGTTARVEAMIQPVGRSRRSTALLVGLGTSGFILSMGGSTLQFHHVLEFLRHVCQIG